MSSGLMPGGFLVIGQLVAPSGTRTIFHQAAPPLGWTQDVSASFSDCDIRVNNASPSTGGSANWSGWNGGSVFNCNAITLAVGNLPVHSHTFNDPTHSHTIANNYVNNGNNVRHNGGGTGMTYTFGVNTNTVNISWNTAATGSGTSFTPTYTTPVLKFSDHILGVKA